MEEVESELRAFLAGRDQWPPPAAFEAAGRSDLYYAARNSRGPRYWASRLGIRPPMPSAERHPWARLRTELAELLQHHRGLVEEQLQTLPTEEIPVKRLQMLVLLYLYFHGLSDVTVRAMAATLGVSQERTLTAIKALAAAGYLKPDRNPDPRRPRRNHHRVNPKGRELVRRFVYDQVETAPASAHLVSGVDEATNQHSIPAAA